MISQGYWIDTQLCIVVLWLLYLATLRRKIPFAAARAYLLLMFPVGLLLPLVQIPILPAPEAIVWIPSFEPLALPDEEPIGIGQPATDWRPILLWTIYGSGAIGIGILQAIRFLRIRFGILRGTRRGDLLFSANVAGAYSAFGRIVVNEKFEGSPMLDAILAHEQSHIGHRHGADLIWISLWRSLLWFHPAAWHAGRLLREVHEFQADKAVIRQGFPLKPYLALLIGTEAGIYPGTVNPLCYLQTKKRLEMMTRTKLRNSSRIGNLLRTMALSATLVGLLCAFSFTARAAAEPTEPPKTYVIEIHDPQPDSLHRIDPDVQPLYVDGQKIDTANDVITVRPRKTSKQPLVVIDGKVADLEQQARLSSHDFREITVLKNQAAIDRFGKAGKNGAIVITTDKKAGSVRKGEGVYYGTYTPDEVSKDTVRIYYGTYTPIEPIDREQLRKASETLRQEMRETALRLQAQSDSLREVAQAVAAKARTRAEELQAEAAAFSQRAQEQRVRRVRKGWIGPGLAISGKSSSLYYRSWENKKSKPVETVCNSRRVTVYLSREEQEQGITPGAKLLKDCPEMFYLDGTTVRNVDPIRVNVYMESLQ
ncbi:MAG: hypothetical protein K2G93_05325 [Rikenella sp.]|nr:hypothetical protein [Rikenella sp.]